MQTITWLTNDWVTFCLKTRRTSFFPFTLESQLTITRYVLRSPFGLAKSGLIYEKFGLKAKQKKSGCLFTEVAPLWESLEYNHWKPL